MVIREDNIEIKVIPTAMGIVEEGAHMCHCVGGYYNHENSLIMSAKINGKRIETIEVSLSSFHLIQSRGVQNKPTPYHEQIVELVNSHMEEIRERSNKYRKVV